MTKPRVLVVFGTRPEVIKLAPVLHELRRREDLDARLCVTAQHREMLDQMMANFGLRPDFDLNLMEPEQDLNRLSCRALPRIQAVLKAARPDFLVVQGDTTTTFVSALAAFYERVPVAHVEAGLRSFDRSNPYPEEINRVMTARLCELHFAPTETARRNLLTEGIRESDVVRTGNTIVDALDWCVSRAHRFADPELRRALEALGPQDKAVLVTTHRRENLGGPLESICEAFEILLRTHPGLHLFYPVHMNPKVQAVVRRRLRHPRAHLLAALDYFDLVHLLRRCDFVLTDSGGLQEEGPSLGKPVVVLRRVTERPEAVEAGVAALAGTDPRAIVEISSRLLQDPSFYAGMARKVGVYGDGKASARIVECLRHRLGLRAGMPEHYLCRA
ncbi:MAG TPA: UDP-N-acetylglucosamine 2-epimerase (non-hydrolyzing) [Elusimicrobiota bacterium]|jgi:UDP-N-acetylglucosamine 2-epimerase|nr:UDP-N-acetylglucosamine 2-epimerase (non-hydrolyzing) [Elusimicrobiota bacterium]